MFLVKTGVNVSLKSPVPTISTGVQNFICKLFLYNNSPANLLNSLRSLVGKNTEPKSGCPLNRSLATTKPLLLKSKYGESI